MKAAVEQARTQGELALPDAKRRALVARYDDVLAAGGAANPPPERPPGQGGRVKPSPARHLLERLLLGEEEGVGFLQDLALPFDNKHAQQDLRRLKVQQKIA